MSDSGLTVPGMTVLPRRYYVTITVDRDGGDPADPADFAVAAGQAASARAASIVSAHTASQIISIVTVLAADQPAARSRRPGRRLRRVQASGRVIHPLTGPL
jgi:hypothetical protein